MQDKTIILTINKGPFLSTTYPKPGPAIITTNIWRIPMNCKAFPFIPIKAPNVLAVLIRNEIEILIKNEANASL